MGKDSIHKILTRFADIRREESYSALLMFLYFFLITTSTYIIKPVKISNFLDILKPERLPLAYLFTALLIGVVAALNSRLLYSMRRDVYISLSLIFFIITILLFWIFFKAQWKWLSMIFWVWVDIFAITTVTQFWIIINDIYHPFQAKRLVGFLVSGGLLGGITGSLLAVFLAGVIGTENLLLICPFLLFFCILIIFAIHKKAPKEVLKKTISSPEAKDKKVGYRESFRTIKKSRHLMLLSGIMLLSIVVTTLVDFQFNSVVESAIEGKDTRTVFLGTFFSGLLLFSYLLHILLTKRILKNFGLRVALMIAPSVLLVCALGVFFIPVSLLLVWAVTLKGSDKSLAHSLTQSVRELLYIPVSPDIKYKAKVFIDMFVNKFAKGIAAFILILCVTLFEFTTKEVTLVIIFFILAWMYLNQRITKEYIQNVKTNLKIKWQDADRFISETVDIDMTKLVFDTLQSKDRSSVLYAMNMFDLLKREKMTPELKKIISHKSDEIRAFSMDSMLDLDGEVLFSGSEDTLDEKEMNDQINEIMAQDVYQQVIKEHIDKIVDKKSGATEISKMESAKVLGMMDPNSDIVLRLNSLLKDDSPEVLKYAIESAGRTRRREFVHRIIPHLSDPTTQRVASKALSGYGDGILGTLKDYLADTKENLRLRKAIPQIMSQSGTQRAAKLLAAELKKKDGQIELEIIDAMCKIRAENSQISFDRETVMAKAVEAIKKSYLILIEMNEVMSDKKKEPLRKDLENNLARSLKLIFDLLSLVYSFENISSAYQNISAGTRKSIDYSLELLDNILKKETKEVLLPLIDDISFEDRVRRCKKMLKTLDKIKAS
ncbi:Npt1/Npt2 family nucleotide transporter [Acidobacteriota bacterium]